jgi:hypothetical protein
VVESEVKGQLLAPTLKLRAARLVAATGGDKKGLGGVRTFVLLAKREG